MAKSSLGIRNCAFALFLTACGSDGDDGPEPGNDSGSPTDAGGNTDAGSTQDAGAPDGATTDSGALDAGDAGTTADSGADSGRSDAGDPELAEALKTEGVVVTMRRVQLVFPAFCRAYAVCSPGMSESECVNQNAANWSDPTVYVENPDWPCDDATLDVASCAATTPCERVDVDCAQLQDRQEMLCADDGGV